MPLLEIIDLTKDFGGVAANNHISLEIERGEIIGLIGPNGAGKTTLFNCIVGYHKPDQGAIRFKGKDITGLKPFQTNREGIGRTFQIMSISGDLTVLENVMVGSFCKTSDRRTARQEASEIMNLTGLEQDAEARLTELPVATQKRVGLAMALATKPELLMLDEVASGLNPRETEEMVALLKNIYVVKGLTLFLTEHVMEVVMPISQRIIVLDGGQKIAEGRPQDIANNERVIRAYLGEKYAKGRRDRGSI
ncbi:MAG: ABC transporter ATP-binding protein [Deltaproteobacteria bacterium]|nr:ABC transporter ATP-binding protein [Deltaproteobacteria bacterium]MBW2077620.1 ABC transporter ATP-binding protein [Deltaproteobacteria bacterium]MBW2310308.1 ABC transporter ATP-binding protein [Deltaproteobacteria bacterium]